MPPAASTSDRDLRFDSLRGLMLLAMTINHTPSLLRRFTDSSLGLFSAAEGFVFLSGLLAGWVYTRKLQRNGYEALKFSARQRAGLIYRWHLTAYFGCFALVAALVYITHFCSFTAPGLFYSHPVLAIGLGSLMLYQPGLLDILPMYCVLVLLLPWVLGALERGKLRWVLAISGGLWLISQFAPAIDGEPLPPLNIGTFNLFAWQFIFVLGLIFGHARTVPGVNVIPRPKWMLPVAALFIVQGLGLRYNFEHWPKMFSETVFGLSLNKPNLGFFRLLDFLSVAYVIALIASRFPKWFSWRPIAFLGQHSLPVVAVQSVIVMGLLQFPQLFRSTWSNLATTAVIIALLYAAATLHHRYHGRTNTRARPTPRSPDTPATGKSIGHVVHAIAAANPVHPRG